MRIVGFYEYGNALRDLDQLIRYCTDEELYELDRIVSEMDEFTVFANLSRKVKSGPSSLNEPIGTENERRGLRWVTALARTELGAITAAFTSVKRPFEKLANIRFDMAEYNALLADGARTHYWALANDSELRSVTRSPRVNRRVLSYGRRIVMAKEMLQAAIDSTPSEQLAYPQLQELKEWQKTLGRSYAIINAKIQNHLTHSYTQEAPVTHEYSHKPNYDKDEYQVLNEVEIRNGSFTIQAKERVIQKAGDKAPSKLIERTNRIP